MSAIHQVLAGFTNGDAISNEARVFQRLFRSWGHASEIFSETARILPELRGQARDLDQLPASLRPDDVALLHLSIGSPANGLFPGLRCRKAILYHNVTPARCFELVNPQTAHLLSAGRRQMAQLAGAAELNLADSAFNAGELAACGYSNVQVFPLLLDLSHLHARPDRGILRRFRDGHTNILFVGRVAPNKRIEDLLAFHAYFRAGARRSARLLHVGSYAGAERYYHLLQARARELGLRNIWFAGAVPQPQLNAYYRCADLFVCMSDHEGFCIPLLEAMAHDIPVMAYAAGAVPETLDGAGVLFDRKDYPLLAELAGALCDHRALRAGVLQRQRQRLARYDAAALAGRLRALLAPLLDRPSRKENAP